ncbi:MAG: Smr/MutS family protein [Thiomicrospira sp.]|uniref:Smr/MutS family protein n=1 Tax=Thiomicrospira sp. TaxID=935 RepID=UPI0019DAEDA0|nr:Smr/MutS family protein [Thiomicrospira sp.]MBE0493213.1 Smr/MutS family protein [Thiomicrospira sp.]
MSKLSEEDKLLFAQAMEGAVPINTSEKATLARPKLKAKRPKTSHIDLIEANNVESVEAVSAHQSLLFHEKGLRLQDLSRLRKGEFSIQARLDLHGDTEEVAQPRLLQFIQQSYLANYRFALIIHGKGYNSDIDYPVLKNLVNQTLRALPQIVAFCSAQQKDGGTGAVYVLLKAH